MYHILPLWSLCHIHPSKNSKSKCTIWSNWNKYAKRINLFSEIIFSLGGVFLLLIVSVQYHLMTPIYTKFIICEIFEHNVIIVIKKIRSKCIMGDKWKDDEKILTFFAPFLMEVSYFLLIVLLHYNPRPSVSYAPYLIKSSSLYLDIFESKCIMYSKWKHDAKITNLFSEHHIYWRLYSYYWLFQSTTIW